MNVGAGLTLKNLIFDSLDSIILRKTHNYLNIYIADYDDSCLSSRSSCCVISGTDIANSASTNCDLFYK